MSGCVSPMQECHAFACLYLMFQCSVVSLIQNKHTFNLVGCKGLKMTNLKRKNERKLISHTALL